MGRIPEEHVEGVKCPRCGSTNINVCQPCGRRKYKCLDCKYLANIDRFMTVDRK